MEISPPARRRSRSSRQGGSAPDLARAGTARPGIPLAISVRIRAWETEFPARSNTRASRGVCVFWRATGGNPSCLRSGEGGGHVARGFQKAFTALLGCSPGRELRRLRLERAMQLLARSEHQRGSWPGCAVINARTASSSPSNRHGLVAAPIPPEFDAAPDGRRRELVIEAGETRARRQGDAARDA